MMVASCPIYYSQMIPTNDSRQTSNCFEGIQLSLIHDYLSLQKSHQDFRIILSWLLNPTQEDEADPEAAILSEAAAEVAAWAAHPAAAAEAAWEAAAGSKGDPEAAPVAPEDRGAGPGEEDQVG